MLKEGGVGRVRGDLVLSLTVVVGGAAAAHEMLGDRGQLGGDGAGRLVLAAVAKEGDDDAMEVVNGKPSVLLVDATLEKRRLLGVLRPFLALLRRLRHPLLPICNHLRAPVEGLLLARLPVDLQTHQAVRVALNSKSLGVGTDNEGDAGHRPLKRRLGMGHGRDGVKLPAGEEVLQLGLCVVVVGGGSKKRSEINQTLTRRGLSAARLYIPCSSPSGSRRTTG